VLVYNSDRQALSIAKLRFEGPFVTADSCKIGLGFCTELKSSLAVPDLIKKTQARHPEVSNVNY